MVSFDDLVSAVIIRWYNRYDIKLSNTLFLGLIDRRPECCGAFGLK